MIKIADRKSQRVKINTQTNSQQKTTVISTSEKCRHGVSRRNKDSCDHSVASGTASRRADVREADLALRLLGLNRRYILCAILTRPCVTAPLTTRTLDLYRTKIVGGGRSSSSFSRSVPAERARAVRKCDLPVRSLFGCSSSLEGKPVPLQVPKFVHSPGKANKRLQPKRQLRSI